MPVVTVRAFAPLMKQRATFYPAGAYDRDGDATFGAGVTYRGALVVKMELVRTASGQEAPSRQAFYVMGNPAIRPEDKIVLSTGDVGSTESYAISPKILSVERFPFTRGQYCTVVRLG